MPVDPQIHGVKPFQECFPETKSTESIAKHPEAKCADPSGAPCSKQSIGLLGRRHVAIDSIIYIGKESNRLEEVKEQSLLDPDAVYTEYPDPRRNEWGHEGFCPSSRPCRFENLWGGLRCRARLFRRYGEAGVLILVGSSFWWNF